MPFNNAGKKDKHYDNKAVVMIVLLKIMLKIRMMMKTVDTVHVMIIDGDDNHDDNGKIIK